MKAFEKKIHTKAQGGPCPLKCCNSFGGQTTRAKRANNRYLRRKAKTGVRAELLFDPEYVANV